MDTRPSRLSGLHRTQVHAALRLFRHLPGYLRHPLDPARARAILQARLAGREAAFLEVIGRLVYGRPDSPYGPLLARAGCELGDVQRLVRQDGVEGALRMLRREGVHLTLDEFKGLQPVRRGSVDFVVTPDRFVNHLLAPSAFVRTGGSTGPGTVVPIDLRFLRDCAVGTALAMEARGGWNWTKANWGVPGGGALAKVIEFSGFGRPPVRWFSQLDPRAEDLEPQYRWAPWLVRGAGLLAGTSMPLPEHVPVDAPLPIARWLAAVLRAGSTPHLFTFVSSAVRLCQASIEAGIDIAGARLMVVGEPATAARLATIARAGVEAMPRYAITETGPIGYGCLNPEAPDDLHLLHDAHAVILAGAGAAPDGQPPDSLLLTSLGVRTPFVLLNVSMGDRATLDPRACGCAIERLGWTQHLREVRSFRQLTAGGMRLHEADVARVLEDVLPARFGGVSTHYQLWEHEGPDGRARLTLVVHPTVGPVDPTEVSDALLGALATAAGAQRVMALSWRAADILRVERRSPLPTAGGKILAVRHGLLPTAPREPTPARE